jgi:indolepyruvate ferredoxin oxidoreductase, beta subunit
MTDAIQNVLIAAVGGQRALLTARVLGQRAQSMGFDVKVSEIHGMSQRGGSVVTHVRFGPEVFSPVIEKGAADTILGFEMLEALRYADCLRPGGTFIVNQQQIPPLPVLTGAVSYPQDLQADFASLDAHTIEIDACALAERAGNGKAVNTVLLGVFASHRGDDRASWLAALQATVPQKHLATNLSAFDLGYAAASLNHSVTDQPHHDDLE